MFRSKTPPIISPSVRVTAPTVSVLPLRSKMASGPSTVTAPVSSRVSRGVIEDKRAIVVDRGSTLVGVHAAQSHRTGAGLCQSYTHAASKVGTDLAVLHSVGCSGQNPADNVPVSQSHPHQPCYRIRSDRVWQRWQSRRSSRCQRP